MDELRQLHAQLMNSFPGYRLIRDRGGKMRSDMRGAIASVRGVQKAIERAQETHTQTGQEEKFMRVARSADDQPDPRPNPPSPPISVNYHIYLPHK